MITIILERMDNVVGYLVSKALDADFKRTEYDRVIPIIALPSIQFNLFLVRHDVLHLKVLFVTRSAAKKSPVPDLRNL